MVLIAQIALGVIIGGATLALLASASLSGTIAREMNTWLSDYLWPEWLCLSLSLLLIKKTL
jgi:hypothetical protein